MKKLVVLLFAISILSVSCTQQTWSDLFGVNDTNVTPPVTDTTATATTFSDTTVTLVQTAQYDSAGHLIPDFVPALQPYLHEACETAWDNVSAIINTDGSITYFTDLPDWTPDSTDYDKDRFQFIIQCKNPWYGVYEGEAPYTMMQVGWYTLPVDDYGTLTCSGLQEIRLWVHDKVTGADYFNSQVCYAVVLCNGQAECNQGYTFDQIEFTPYDGGYQFLTTTHYSEY
jgi:hypothetical protein